MKDHFINNIFCCTYTSRSVHRNRSSSLILFSFFYFFMCLLGNLHLVAQPPDPYGYTWKHSDSLNGPVYNWIDITGVGEELQGLEDDNIVGPISMEIDFPYYWYHRSRLWISDNGVMSFNPISTIADVSPMGFPALPAADGQENLIAPLMADMTFLGPNNPAKVYTYADSANQRFIVSYHEVPLYANNAAGYDGANTFQVIFSAQDSTITFQYAVQNGTIDPVYQSRTRSVVIGIEDVTGTLGLQVMDSLPEALSAIQYFPPKKGEVDVRDLRSIWLQNPRNGGFFYPYTPPPAGPKPNFWGVVANIGNTNFDTPVSADFTFHIPSASPITLNATIPAPFESGMRDTLDFQLPVSPPFPGTYTLELTATHANDINHLNDSMTVEMVVVDTFGGAPFFSYVSNDPTLADGTEGRADSTGKSGLAVYFRPFAYPSLIEEVEFFFSPIDSFSFPSIGDAYRVEVYGEGPVPGKPGPLLFSQTQQTKDVSFGQWQPHVLDPPLVLNKGGFYVAWIPLSDSVLLISESRLSAPPISRRSFEIQDGSWKVHRSNGRKDFWIQVLMNTSQVRTTSLPPLPIVKRFDVYPNPTTDWIHLEIDLRQTQNIRYALYDVSGRKLSISGETQTAIFRKTLDVSDLSEGTYFFTLETTEGKLIKKIVKE